jgi:hypothetical protein
LKTQTLLLTAQVDALGYLVQPFRHFSLISEKMQSGSELQSRPFVVDGYMEVQVSRQYPSKLHSQRWESRQLRRVSMTGHFFRQDEVIASHVHVEKVSQ